MISKQHKVEVTCDHVGCSSKVLVDLQLICDARTGHFYKHYDGGDLVGEKLYNQHGWLVHGDGWDYRKDKHYCSARCALRRGER